MNASASIDNSAAEPAMPVASLDQIMKGVQEDIVRLHAMKEVARQERDEQARRVAEEHMYDVRQQLLRRASQRTVDLAVQEEQKRLIAEENLHTVQEDVVRKAHQLQADHEMDAEKARRVSEGTALPADVAGILRAVHGDLVSSIAQFRATAERRAQATHGAAKARVNEELERKANARLVEAAAEEERQRRLSGSPVPTELARSFARLNEQIERHGAQQLALQLMKEEKERREQEDKKAAMQEQLERRAAAKAADEAEAQGRAEKEHQERMGLLAGELTHDSDTSHLAAQLTAINEAVLRYQAVKAALDASNFEQARSIAARQKSLVLDDLLSRVHRKQAAAQSELARAEQEEMVKARTAEVVHRQHNVNTQLAATQ